MQIPVNHGAHGSHTCESVILSVFVIDAQAVVKAQQAADAKPISAYSQFVVDNYPAAKAKNPGMPFIQVGAVIGRQSFA